MKFLKNFLSGLLTGLSILSVIIVVSSCDDKDDPRPIGIADVKIVNGIYGTGKFNVKINGAMLGDKTLAYRNSTPYIRVPGSKSELTVSVEGSDTQVLKTTLDLQTATNYSIYLVSQTTNLNSPEVFVIKDEFKVAAKKAGIRFVNALASTELALYMNGKPVAAANTVAYKKSSPFVEIDPVENAVFEMRVAGGDEVLARSNETSIKEGEFFTLWAVGPVQRVENPDYVLGIIKNK